MCDVIPGYRISSNRSRVSNTSRVSNRSRGQTSFVLIEAGSLIQAGSLTEAGGLKANIIELIAHTPIALWCIAFIRAYCVISRTAVWPTGYFALQ